MAKINLKNLLAVSAGLIIVVPTSIGILANVNIPVTKQISTEQIVEEINQVKTYGIMMFIKTGVTVEKLKEEITPELIEEQLQGDIKAAFKASSFEFKDFIYNDRNLEDGDLESFGIINVEIKYDYGWIKNQTTKLTINKTMAPEDVNQAILNVQEYKKSIKVNSGNSVEKFTKEINGTFIQSHLEDNASNALVPNSFSVNSITYNGNDLEDNDLRREQRIVTVVNYNYDDYGGELTLIINITPKTK